MMELYMEIVRNRTFRDIDNEKKETNKIMKILTSRVQNQEK